MDHWINYQKNYYFEILVLKYLKIPETQKHFLSQAAQTKDKFIERNIKYPLNDSVKKNNYFESYFMHFFNEHIFMIEIFFL